VLLETVVDKGIVDDVDTVAPVVLVVPWATTVVLVSTVVLVVGASTVDEVVGAVVLVGATVVLVVLVLVAVVDVVLVVVGTQSEMSSTEVESEAWKLALQTACTVSVTLPVAPPGIGVVADVVPFPGTSEYPVTANVCAPRLATAVEMCIVLSCSLFPSVHVMTWVPLEHTVRPDRSGWWAHAGAAVATTNNVTIADNPPAKTPRRRSDP